MHLLFTLYINVKILDGRNLKDGAYDGLLKRAFENGCITSGRICVSD